MAKAARPGLCAPDYASQFKNFAKLTQFLNFHTHNFSPKLDEKSIYNLLIQDAKEFDDLQNDWISVGIHPWYADAKNWESQLRIVEKMAVHEKVLAIGECGLDRLIELPIDKQLTIFEIQIKIAEYVQKPVIIHCVRAFNELLQWKKQTKQTVPLIVHGFNSKSEIAQQLLAHGFYFSLGAALLKGDSNASKIVKNLPVEKLFLENDNSNIPIEIIYEAAATQLQMTISELKNQIWANFVALFEF